MLGIIGLADPLITLFGGIEFKPSAKVMQILASLLVIITLSGFLGHQILIPHHKEKYGNYCVIGGAITNLSLNAILIPLYAEIGVAISVVISEIVVTCLHFFFAKNLMSLKLIDFLPWKCFVSAMIMFFVIYMLNVSFTNPLLCILWAIIGMLVYSLSLALLRDNFFINTIKQTIKR